ncbi:MAG: hypothetical protein ACYTAN_12660 [Planctomycetota bacterium]|jgi:prepilin-type processing-associated H-X9-DG protein
MGNEEKFEKGNPPVEPAGEVGGNAPAADVEIPDGGAQPKAGGLRLADLFVLLFIVAVLATLLLPAIRRARISGTAIACRDNLRRIGVAIGLYQVDYDELFPRAHTVVWRHYPEGWEVNWPTSVGDTTYSLPLQTLAVHGYLDIAWRDNRDRVAESVCRCPSDRAAQRPIQDPRSFNSCKRAHCAGGLTISYAQNHPLHATYFPSYRNWSLVLHAPEKTMCLGEYDWHNHSRWFALAGGIRPDSKNRINGGFFSYRYNNNAHCPTDRHGGIVNILFADLHVEGRDPFEWRPDWAFSRCDPADTVIPYTPHKPYTEPTLFYWPPGYGL